MLRGISCIHLFHGNMTELSIHRTWLDRGACKQQQMRNIIGKRTHWALPACRPPLCPQHNSQRPWGRIPLETGPCWKQWADRSYHRLHLPQSLISSEWQPSAKQKNGTDEVKPVMVLFLVSLLSIISRFSASCFSTSLEWDIYRTNELTENWLKRNLVFSHHLRTDTQMRQVSKQPHQWGEMRVKCYKHYWKTTTQYKQCTL